MIEQRRHARVPLQTAVVFVVDGQSAESEGHAKDISLGGMFVETASPAAFGARVTVRVQLPGHAQVFSLPGVVRWVRSDGMGLQFGLLGALETHAITELGR